MMINFLGTGTSMGVPVAGGFGHQSNDPKDFRYRCSVWVTTEKVSIVIDIGPEFRLQTLRAGIQRIDLILLTHEHNDHVAGLDDLRPFNYHQNAILPIFTTRSCIDSILRRFHYMFEPDKVPGSVDVHLAELKEPLLVEDLLITPLPVKHGALDVLGFRLNDFSYVTDANYIPPETRDLMRGSKICVLSGLRWEPPHPTHMTIPEAIRVAEDLNCPNTYLVHMSTHVIHDEIQKRMPSCIQLAYDGLELQL